MNHSLYMQLFVWFQHALWLYHCEHIQIQNTLHCKHNTPLFKFVWSTLQCVLNTCFCSTNYNNSMVSGIARGGWSSIIHYVVLFSRKTSCALIWVTMYNVYIDISLYQFTIYTCTCSCFVYSVGCYHACMHSKKQNCHFDHHFVMFVADEYTVKYQDGMIVWRKVGWEWGKGCHVVVLHIVMNCVHSSSWIWNKKLSVVMTIP